MLKPAEQSPALRLTGSCRRCAPAACPPAAIALLPGEGDVGAALVRHPRVHDDRVHRLAAGGARDHPRRGDSRADGQRHFKQVVAELGGKNCVIVDADADLDEAVPGIVGSAFVYAGQKCSAASRVLVHEAIADQLIERIAGAVRVLVVGQAQELGTDVPPVIEQAAQERVGRYAAARRARGRIVAQAEPVPDATAGSARPPWPPTCPPDSPVLEEEIFGPLLAIERVRDVEHACDIVDGLPFALTGGLFARDPATVRCVRERTPGRQPVRQPRDHRGDGRPPAVRRQPAVGHRDEGRRPGLPAAVRRAARGDREHDAPRARSCRARRRRPA